MKKTAQSREDGRTKKEADKAYRELEKKILEKNRRADERKYKPTSKPQSDFHKTTCRHCGVNVEYPSEAEGQMAQCPKCGENVILVGLSKGGANGQKSAMKQVLQNDDYATEPKTPQRREGMTFNSTALPASKPFKNDAPYSTPSNFVNFDQSKAAKPNNESTPLDIVFWIFVVVCVFCTICNMINDGADEIIKTPIAFVFIGLSLALYFLPSYIAYEKNKKNAGAVFALNLLTGWTVIGWVISLVWALAND